MIYAVKARLPKRVAIYARFSSELQNERQIDDYVALCRDHAERCGRMIVDTYADLAISAALIHGRFAFERLGHDAWAGGGGRGSGCG